MTVLSILLEYKATIFFYSFIVLMVYLNKDRFDKLGSLTYIYRTKFGLTLMDKISKKFKKFVKFTGFIGVIAAYGGVLLISVVLIMEAFKIVLRKPEAMGAGPVLPGFEIAGTGIVFPLLIGWIALFIIMIVHEFSHGVVARAYNIKVKSSGIAFFGPLLGAFVEPDEKELKKKSYKAQLSVFAAGPFSNVILWLFCILLLATLYPSSGVNIQVMQNETYPAYLSGMPQNVTVLSIENTPIKTLGKLSKTLDLYGPLDKIDVLTDKGKYEVTLTSHPDDDTRGYMGIWILGEKRNFVFGVLSDGFFKKVMDWITSLIFWTGFISINIGLINLFPIFITDGAQMLRANFEYFFKKNKKKGEIIWKRVNSIALFVLFVLMVPFFMGLLKGLFSLLTGQVSLF